MFFPFFSRRPLISGLSLTTGVAAAQSSKTEALGATNTRVLALKPGEKTAFSKL